MSAQTALAHLPDPVSVPEKPSGPDLKIYSEPSDAAEQCAHLTADGRLSRQERLNQITHAIGFLFFVGCVSQLWSKAVTLTDPVLLTGAMIYGFSLCGLYLASTLSHSFVCQRKRIIWRAIDQIAILGLGVGNFTPYAIAYLQDDPRMILLPIMWTAVIVLSIKRWKLGEEGLKFGGFVLLGSLPLLTSDVFFSVSGMPGFGLVLAGGFFYLGGMWFLVNDDRSILHHPTWHICTVVGSACHFLFIHHYVIVV